MFRLLKSTFFLLSLSLFLFSTVHAQGVPGVGAPLTIIPSTENPRPGDVVRLTAQSYSFDIDSAKITWSVDGKLLSSGVGLKRVDVTAGEIGSIKTVTITLLTPEGTVSQSLDIRPGDIALLWESSSYVPAFYKGKALFSHGGSYKITAFPTITGIDGKLIDPKTLVYKWSKNGTEEESSSGYGKSSYSSVQSSFVRSSDDIRVTVIIPGENFSFSGSVDISPVDPEIVFYEKNPLYGTWLENALPNIFKLNRDEVAVQAEPYYFSTNARKTNLEFGWSVNDEPVFNFDNQGMLILRKVDDQSGTANIDLSVSNKTYILQGANNGLTIRYE